MASPAPTDPVLLAVDVNVFVADLLSRRRGRQGSLAWTLVQAVREGRFGDVPLQLAMSQEMLGTLERVLVRLGVEPDTSHEFVESVGEIMRTGPSPMEPYLLVAGRDQLTASDREDAGVLASAILARADLLVTDNLDDFRTNDGEVVPTRSVSTRDGGSRDLYAIVFERADGVALVIGHPLDVVDWLRSGLRPTPEAIRQLYRLAPGRKP